MKSINKFILGASLAIIFTPTLGWSLTTPALPTDITTPAPSVTPKISQPLFNVSITNDTQSDVKIFLNTCKADVCKADASVGLDLRESITNVVSVSDGALIALRDLKGGTTASYWLPLNKKTYQLVGQVDGKESQPLPAKAGRLVTD